MLWKALDIPLVGYPVKFAYCDRLERFCPGYGISRAMKHHFLHSIVFVLVCVCAGLVNAQSPGTQAPPFHLEGPSGSINLSDLRGKVVYLDFWASWCGPCKESFPWMEHMQGKYADMGLTVVAVNLDKRREDALKFLQNRRQLLSVVWDPQGLTPKAYAVKAMPTSVLIGRDGKILKVHSGFRSDGTADLESQVRLALQTKE